MGIIRKGFKSMFQKAKRWKIQTGDKVKIVAGKDKGQAGTVLRVIRDAKWPRVVVEGCNLVSIPTYKPSQLPHHPILTPTRPSPIPNTTRSNDI